MNDDQVGRPIRPLEEITAEARAVYGRMEKDYYRFGELMLEAKPLVPRGQWLNYLEENFPAFGQRQAYRYMQMVRENKTLNETVIRESKDPPLSLTPESSYVQPLVRTTEEKQTINRRAHIAIDKALREQRREFSNWAKILISKIKDAVNFQEIQEVINALDKLSVTDLLLAEDLAKACLELSDRAHSSAYALNNAIGDLNGRIINNPGQRPGQDAGDPRREKEDNSRRDEGYNLPVRAGRR